jgi:hypothetical protein
MSRTYQEEKDFHVESDLISGFKTGKKNPPEFAARSLRHGARILIKKHLPGQFGSIAIRHSADSLSPR